MIRVVILPQEVYYDNHVILLLLACDEAMVNDELVAFGVQFSNQIQVADLLVFSLTNRQGLSIARAQIDIRELVYANQTNVMVVLIELDGLHVAQILPIVHFVILALTIIL